MLKSVLCRCIPKHDNCPDVKNPSQQDIDEDSKGDACDCDIDGDGKIDKCSTFVDEDLDGAPEKVVCSDDRLFLNFEKIAALFY